MNSKQDFIAVFDSGVGGISVLRQLRRQLPNERFLYFGDSANAPYGTRPTQQVRELSLAVAEKLIPRGIKALVVACNTATAAAIDTLRQAHPDLIIVGVEPALKLAADHCPGRAVGVMATPVTLREEKFNHLAARFEDACQIVRLPAPGLVELVEAGKANSPETVELLTQLLGPWLGKLDAMVLGCTHYPFAIQALRKVIGEDIPIYDGSEGTARETRRRLEAAGLLREGTGEILFENSANDPRLIALGRQLLEME
jgi:glutamate racemase